MLFPGNACDVWPGELPPGWELEWVDDEEWLHHGQASNDVIISFSYLPLFSINSELFIVLSKNYVCNNGPYGDVMLICKALWTLLRGSFNASVRSSLCCQVIYRALTTLNGMIPYYRLMTKWSGLGDSTELSRMGLSQLRRSRQWRRPLALLSFLEVLTRDHPFNSGIVRFHPKLMFLLSFHGWSCHWLLVAAVVWKVSSIDTSASSMLSCWWW
jgi:hypothetical protein